MQSQMRGDCTVCEQAADAVREGRGRQFVDQRRCDSAWWRWLTGPDADVRLFLALAQYLSPAEQSRLPAHRRLTLRQYQVAGRSPLDEPRPFVMTRLQAIWHAMAESPPDDVELDRSAAEVLDSSYRTWLMDEAHAAVFAYALLYAAERPELRERVTTVIARVPVVFEISGLLSAAAVSYGARLIDLLAAACLESAERKRDIADLIESVTGRRRWGREFDAFAHDTLVWYRAHHDRLAVDTDALYPAFWRPLFVLK